MKQISFTITENAVLQSEQLSKSEKWFYIALKSFRHNSPPIRCNPSLPRIEKRAQLSHPTVLKIRKLLETKGLIKIKSRGPGAGRARTNNYIFTLEDGTDEEKERLLAYLKAKKNSKILTRFKDKKTVKKKTVLSQKNGLEFNEKTVKKKTSNNKYLTKRKQQQGKTKKPNVVASLSNKKGKEPNLLDRLIEIGIGKDKARELLATHLYSNIEKQLEWLPYRKNIDNPAGALIRAIEQNWPEPPRIAEKIEKKRAIQNTILRDAKEDLKKGAGPERVKEWLEKLDPEYQDKLREFVEELNNGSKTKRDSSG